ncbi:MAG: hypothetical protein ACKOPO_06040 [Novosphingobium sp.]
MHILAIVGVLLLFAVLSSTKEGVAENRAKLAKYNWFFWSIAIVLGGIMLYGVITHP